METPKSSSEVNTDQQLADTAKRGRMARAEYFKDHFSKASVVFLWFIVIAFICGGIILFFYLLFTDKESFLQVTFAGVSFVIGLFAPRISKILDGEDK